MSQCQSLWYIEAGRVELRDERIPRPHADEVLIKARYSGLSRGTERLVLNGRVPASEYTRMRCPYQVGSFPFPVKYGYALTGEIVDGPARSIGKTVFVLHPHQEMACVKSAHLHEIPAGVPLRRAALAANTETAVNVLWDAALAPGERVMIIGGGVLGLLIARLIARGGENQVTVVDINPGRADIAQALGASFSTPENAPENQHAVIHTSATEQGLRLALNHCASDGRIVEASWFGNQDVSLPLGEAFHSRRLRLVSSQVGSIPPANRSEWTPARRMQAAMDHLKDERFEALITGEIDFADAPDRVPQVLSADNGGLMTVLRYS